MSNELNRKGLETQEVVGINTEVVVPDNDGSNFKTDKVFATQEQGPAQNTQTTKKQIVMEGLGGLSAESILYGAPQPYIGTDVLIPVCVSPGTLFTDLAEALYFEINRIYNRVYNGGELAFTADELVSYLIWLVKQRTLASTGKAGNDVRYHDAGWYVPPVVAVFLDQIGYVRDAQQCLSFYPFMTSDEKVLKELMKEEQSKASLFKVTESYETITFKEASKVSRELYRLSSQGLVVVPYKFIRNEGGELSFMSMTWIEQNVASFYGRQHPIFAVAASLFSNMAIYEASGVIPRVTYGHRSYYEGLIEDLARID